MSEEDVGANPLEDDGAGYLISVSDMMAGLLFVFLITLVAFVINFQAATDEKEVQTRNAEVERDAAAYARQEAENARELALEEARAAEEERDAATLARQEAENARKRALLEKERAEAQRDAARREKERLESVRDGLTNARGLRRQMLDDIRQRLKEHGIRVEIDHDHGVLRLTENAISFESGKAELAASERAKLARISAVLMDVLPCYAASASADCDARTSGKLEAVFIEGHTDNVPLGGGRFRDNWDLSAQRAMYTYRILATHEPEIPVLRNARDQPLFSVSGYGDGRPVVKHTEPTAEPRNRRIDLRFIMIPPSATQEPEPVRTLRGRGVR